MARQLHKRFSQEQIVSIVSKFAERKIRAKEACGYLGIGRTRLHELVTDYRLHPEQFSVSYKRITANNYTAERVKEHILTELTYEKEKIIDNPDVPTNR